MRIELWAAKQPLNTHIVLTKIQDSRPTPILVTPWKYCSEDCWVLFPLFKTEYNKIKCVHLKNKTNQKNPEKPHINQIGCIKSQNSIVQNPQCQHEPLVCVLVQEGRDVELIHCSFTSFLCHPPKAPPRYKLSHSKRSAIVMRLIHSEGISFQNRYRRSLHETGIDQMLTFYMAEVKRNSFSVFVWICLESWRYFTLSDCWNEEYWCIITV